MPRRTSFNKDFSGGLFCGRNNRPKPLEPKKSMWRNLKPEESIQIEFFNWLRGAEEKYPILQLAFHPANGFFVHISIAKKMKAMGVRAGVFDFILLAPSADGQHAALVMDFKTDTGRLSTAQKTWLAVLTEFYPNVLTAAPRSPKEAAKVVVEYLGLPINKLPLW